MFDRPHPLITLLAALSMLSLLACDRSSPPQQPIAQPSNAVAQAAEQGALATPSSQPSPGEKTSDVVAMPPGADENPAAISQWLGTFPSSAQRVELSPEQWKEKLTDKEFYVLRKSGTERAFTGDLLDNHEEGIYTCAGCGAPLFSSHTKFKSGTGWPSFYQPIEAGRVGEEKDATLGMVRTEVHCQKCGGHLGHVFDDGPEPTGLRYCINAVSLNFSPVQANRD